MPPIHERTLTNMQTNCAMEIIVTHVVTRPCSYTSFYGTEHNPSRESAPRRLERSQEGLCRFHGADGGGPKGKRNGMLNTGSPRKMPCNSGAWFENFFDNPVMCCCVDQSVV
jgi:hypothetical protein